MNLDERIASFSELGKILREAVDDRLANESRKDNKISGDQTSQINRLIENQYLLNPWFTPENVRMALSAIAHELTENNLLKWTSGYPLLREETKPLRVGVIMAGNIPLVGFHDFLSVLVSGNDLVAKASAKDSELIRYISRILCSYNPGFRNKIRFTNGILSDFDLIIATGSNNSARYFEYYFGKYPNIIRKNRNSIAILEGNETSAELRELGKDIFSYFGLGCRNVSKIYIPEGYDLNVLADCWHPYSEFIKHQKYANNYDFNKAVSLVNKEPFFDTGYLLIKYETRLSSPVSVLHYENYKSEELLNKETVRLKENIQCIAGKKYLAFGKTQSPHLWDYADGIDTLEFLLKKKSSGIL